MKAPFTHYTKENFPIFVAHHGNWDIYRDDKGNCAALPVVPGCLSSHFGDMRYTRCVLAAEGVSV
jgi:hypothetical protein